MKKIKIIVLSLALALVFLPNRAHASVESERIIIEADLSAHKEILAKTKQAIKDGKIKLAKDKLDRLKALIESTEEILNELEDLKKNYRDNIRIRKEIRSHLQNRDTYFSVDIGRVATNKEISELFLDVAREDDYFYYGQYASTRIDTAYKPNKSKTGAVYIENAKFDVKYRVDIDMEYASKKFVKKWVEENIDPYLTEYAKVKEIHDFIVKKNFYNKGDGDEESGGVSIYHPASIIFGNGGVCNAYATLFDLMAKQTGLETRLITGKSLKTGEDHMWNMVKIMGNWYHIDTTWDDPIINFNDKDIENIQDFVIYDYFLKSDAEIKKSRTINESENRPKAPNNFPTSPKNSKIEEIDGKYYVR